MTEEQFYALQTEQGKALLAQLQAEPLADDALLSVLERYRKAYPVELVNAAVELTRLRRQAVEKFPSSSEMFFTRPGLEMATAEPVAHYTAQRYAGLRRVLDLCCGLGGDALALAQSANAILAVDRDSLTLAMAQANARAMHLHDRITFIHADVIEFTKTVPLLVGPIDGIFIDPSRRSENHRVSRKPEDYSPSLSWCMQLTRVAPRVGIKVSPALDFGVALEGTVAEIELISLHRECKEAVLWMGGLRTCASRATVLPGDHTLTEVGPTSNSVSDVGSWLYEPDPALIRAQLIQRLAGELNLRRIDESIAYLTGDEEVHSPFISGYRVLDVIPWGLKRLNTTLAEHGIGHVTIKKRGFPLTPEELRPKLKLTGSKRATLICTRVQGDAVVIIAE